MLHCSARHLTSVAVLGACGGIGQPLSLLLTTVPYVTELRLNDLKGVPGVAADLSHIPCNAKILGFDDAAEAVKGAEVVLIPAGVPRKPGMTRDDLFTTNAGVIRDLVKICATHAPKAFIGVITNPVNSTVPIAAEVLKKAGVYDPARLFGVNEMDLIRSRTFVAEVLKKKPSEIADQITVVGGHSGNTIIPILSAFPALKKEEIETVTHRVQFGGDEVVKAKAGAGSATLSMAHAGALFATSLIRAINGEKAVTAHAFVECAEFPDCPYFCRKMQLGKNGVEKILPIPKMSAYEESLLKECLKELKSNIEKGVKFAAQ